MSFRQIRSPFENYHGAELPTVTTEAASSVTDVDAIGNGTVVSEGNATLTEHGFVWSSTNPIPTIADSNTGELTSTIGAFTLALGSLSPSTTYYYRAYAINLNGGYSYGDIEQFTTAAAGGATPTRHLFMSLGVGG